MQQTLPRRLARKEEELAGSGDGRTGNKNSFLKVVEYVNAYGKDAGDKDLTAQGRRDNDLGGCVGGTKIKCSVILRRKDSFPTVTREDVTELVNGQEGTGARAACLALLFTN